MIQRSAHALLITYCTALSCWFYIKLDLITCYPGCVEAVRDIADGTAPAPFAYRLLVPKLLALWDVSIPALLVYHAVTFALFYALLLVWSLRHAVTPFAALPLVALATAAMMPTWGRAVYMPVEWILFLCALLCLPRWRSSPA